MSAEYRNEHDPVRRALVLVRAGVKKAVASRETGVSRHSLDRALVAVREGRNVGVAGRPRIIPLKIEDEFEGWVDGQIQRKRAVRFAHARELIQSRMNRLNSDRLARPRQRPCDTCIRDTLKRCKLGMRKMRLLDAGRAEIPEVEVREFFSNFEGLVQEHAVVGRNIHNMDETSLSLGSREGGGYVIERAANMGVTYIDTEQGPNIRTTFIVTSSAAGFALPTMVLLNIKSLPDHIESVLFNTSMAVTYSPNGWNTHSTFDMWTRDVFIPAVEERRRFPEEHCVLVLDGASCRSSIPALELMREHNVHVVTLPAHTSHFLQPADQYIFATFKKTLREGGLKTDLESTLLQAATGLAIGLSPMSIKRSWEATGLWPALLPKILESEFVVAGMVRRARRRKRIPIANRVLTRSDFIDELRLARSNRQ